MSRRLILTALTVACWVLYLVTALEAVYHLERFGVLGPVSVIVGAIAVALLNATLRWWPNPLTSGGDARLLRTVADELSAAADRESDKARNGDLPGRGDARLDGYARGFAAGHAVSVLAREATGLRQRALSLEAGRGEPSHG